MMDLQFDVPNPAKVRERLVAGYRGRRNFLILELFSAIVYQTPRKTGRARGGWQISIGGPVEGEVERKDYDGSDTVMEEIGKLKGTSPFASVYLGNQVPYIDDLEEGTSAQAPDGIVRVVVPAYRSIYGDLV